MSFVSLVEIMNKQTGTCRHILVLVMMISALQGSPPLVSNSLAEGQVTDAERGRSLYNKKGCYYCHGFEGQGGLITGSRLAPNPLPLVAFTNAVRRPRNVMPAYSSAGLSDTELESIHYFLTTIPQPPVLDALPMFSDEMPD